MALNLLMAKNPKKVQLVMERDGTVDFFVGPMIKIAKANIPPAKLRSIILDYIRGNKNE
jgi:Asp-tRNA(Asn)/Glu-tRNA(Gln) amidotransferase B subunit